MDGGETVGLSASSLIEPRREVPRHKMFGFYPTVSHDWQ